MSSRFFLSNFIVFKIPSWVHEKGHKLDVKSVPLNGNMNHLFKSYSIRCATVLLVVDKKAGGAGRQEDRKDMKIMNGGRCS